MKKKFITFAMSSIMLLGTALMSKPVYAATNNINWKLHTGTALSKTGKNCKFAMGDYNHDGVPDLYFINKSGTGSHSTEVHVLNGKDNFQSFLLHTGTPIEECRNEFDFALGDYNRDGILDLYCIKKNHTGCNSTAVHILNGKDNFQSFLMETNTALGACNNDYDFSLGDYNRDGILDLYCIKKNGTRNSTDVHVLNGKNNFQSFLLETNTALGQTNKNYQFGLSDYNNDGMLDLYCIKKNGTGSHSTEVHILNGKDNFQSFLLQTGTPLEETDENSQIIVGKGRFNIYDIKKLGASSTEVHQFGFNGSTTNNSTVDRVIQEAKRHLGQPYVWGATGPNRFDCSGFVKYVYGKCGIHISRITTTQIHDGFEVAKNQLKPGDLVFFGSYNAPHHVGMYIGGGKFIEAPHTGDVVKISSLSGRRDFCRARRIIR